MIFITLVDFSLPRLPTGRYSKYKNETVGVKQRNHVLIKKRSFCQNLMKMDPLLLHAD